MGPKVMLNIRQQSGCFIARRLHNVTIETGERLLHEGMPRVLITGWGRLLQKNVVALGVHGHQAQPAGKRFILGHGEVFGGHVFGQTRTFLSAVRHDGLLHLTVDLVLRPIGRRDKAIKTGEFHQQTHQANATGPHFRTYQVYPEHQTMQEGQTWNALEKRHDGGTLVQAFLIRTPCLQRAARYLKRLGGLTLGESLGLQIAILRQQLSTFDAIPTLVALIIAYVAYIGLLSHRYLLLLKPLSW